MKHLSLYERDGNFDCQSWGGFSKNSVCEAGVHICDTDVSWLNEFGGVKKFNKDGLEIVIYKLNHSELVEYGVDLLGNFKFKEIEDFFTTLFPGASKMLSITFSENFISVRYKMGTDNPLSEISHSTNVYDLDELKPIVERRKYYIIL